MDAILLLVLIPQEGKKAIFHTENEAERETPNLGKGLEATKKNKPKTICPPAMGWLKPVKNPP